MSGETLALVYLSAAKGITYLAFLGMTGSVGARLVVLPLCRHRDLDAQTDLLVQVQTRRVVLVSAAVLIVAAGLRLYAQTYSVFGLDERVTFQLMTVVALETRWGTQWVPQFAVSILAAACAVIVGLVPGSGWRLMAAAVAGVAVTLPMTGHAMAYPGGAALPWTLQVGHVLAAGLWLGTLGVVLVIGTSSGSGPTSGARASMETLVNAFSPVALVGVIAVLVTGTATGVLYVEHWRELWQTPYGLMLSGKVILVLATGAMGAYNWRVLRPKTGTAIGRALLIRSARLELVLACAVLTLTALLVHLPMPHE